MKAELFLIRHADALDKSPEIKDLDRQLSPAGLRNSSVQGEFLKKNKILPDLIVSSNAIRATFTAHLIAERIGYDISRIIVNDEVYEASVRTLLSVVNQLNDDLSKVFIIGHNPSISYLAEYISKSEIGDILPGSIVRLSRLTDSWSLVSENTCELISYNYPGELEEKNNE